MFFFAGKEQANKNKICIAGILWFFFSVGEKQIICDTLPVHTGTFKARLILVK